MQRHKNGLEDNKRPSVALENRCIMVDSPRGILLPFKKMVDFIFVAFPSNRPWL